jgi:hypothetical protein
MLIIPRQRAKERLATDCGYKVPKALGYQKPHFHILSKNKVTLETHKEAWPILEKEQESS